MKCKHCDGKGSIFIGTIYNPITGDGYISKCPYCNGTGEVKVTGDSVTDICNKCGGTGEITLTNEEYLCTCSTEERAKFLTEVILSDRRFRMTMIGGIEETKAWLKEKYYGNTSTENL